MITCYQDSFDGMKFTPIRAGVSMEDVWRFGMSYPNCVWQAATAGHSHPQMFARLMEVQNYCDFRYQSHVEPGIRIQHFPCKVGFNAARTWGIRSYIQRYLQLE